MMGLLQIREIVMYHALHASTQNAAPVVRRLKETDDTHTHTHTVSVFLSRTQTYCAITKGRLCYTDETKLQETQGWEKEKDKSDRRL